MGPGQFPLACFRQGGGVGFTLSRAGRRRGHSRPMGHAFHFSTKTWRNTSPMSLNVFSNEIETRRRPQIYASKLKRVSNPALWVEREVNSSDIGGIDLLLFPKSGPTPQGGFEPWTQCRRLNERTDWYVLAETAQVRI